MLVRIHPVHDTQFKCRSLGRGSGRAVFIVHTSTMYMCESRPNTRQGWNCCYMFLTHIAVHSNMCILHTRHSLYVRFGHLYCLCFSCSTETDRQDFPAGIFMIESVVLPSLSSDLIMISELLVEKSSPGIWYCSVVIIIVWTRNLPPVSSNGSKDRYEEVWIEGWI